MAEEHIANSLNAETSSLSKQKPVITLNAFGLPVGDHSTKLASRCGELVHTIVPISIKDWRAVPKEKKDELWKHLQKRQKKKDDPPLTRAKVRIKAHKRKDDSIPSSVSSHMERVKELLSSQDEVDSHDILKDPSTQIFGVDMGGRVRGVGNVVSRTQIVGSSTTLEKLATKEKKVIEESTSIKNLKDKVDYVTSAQKKLFEELGAIKQMIELQWPMPSGSQASVSFPPKMTKLGAVSNTLGSDGHSMRLRPCKLMSWHREVVAHGRAHIGNGTQFIHDKPLPKNAYKVTVDVIVKGDVDLPFPDGYHSTLGQVGNGSFVAWPDVFTTFTD